MTKKQQQQASTTTRIATASGSEETAFSGGRLARISLDERCLSAGAMTYVQGAGAQQRELPGCLFWRPGIGKYEYTIGWDPVYESSDREEISDQRIPYALTYDGLRACGLDVDPDCDNDVMDELGELSELGYGSEQP